MFNAVLYVLYVIKNNFVNKTRWIRHMTDWFHQNLGAPWGSSENRTSLKITIGTQIPKWNRTKLAHPLSHVRAFFLLRPKYRHLWVFVSFLTFANMSFNEKYMFVRWRTLPPAISHKNGANKINLFIFAQGFTQKSLENCSLLAILC